MDQIDRIICGDGLEVMAGMPDESVDLVVTSPPYDNLRDYHGYSLDVPMMCIEFMRIMKQGGIIVWVVGDATINGSETGTSFRQALTFMDAGFRLHDTMIWNKNGSPYPEQVRYYQCFEYMFIFSKGKPGTIYLIKDRENLWRHGSWGKRAFRQSNGTFQERAQKPDFLSNKYGIRFNVWNIDRGRGLSTRDDVYNHPAIFPEQLAADHIRSWSNEGDLVLDPMCGSGTTCKMAERLNRHWVGIDISEEYCQIARERIRIEQSQLKLDFSKAAG